MAYDRPPLTDLREQTESDFSSKFYGTAAKLRRSVLKVFARVWAALINGTYGYISWAFRNNFAHLCDHSELEKHGNEVGVYRKAAEFTDGPVELTGADGDVVPESTLLQSADGLYTYQTIGEATVGSTGTVQITVVATEEGVNYNAPATTSLQLVSPITGTDVLDEVIVVGDGLSGGADLEDPEAFRDRILFKKRNPPQGGAVSDYIIWATSVQPVTRAFITPQFPQANSVTVVCANYNQEPPTLTTSEVQGVDDYLQSDDIKPVTADVRTHSVVAREVVVEARISPLTTASKTAATQQLKDLYIREGIPKALISASALNAAIYSAPEIDGVEIDKILLDGIEVTEIQLDVYGVAVSGGESFTGL